MQPAPRHPMLGALRLRFARLNRAAGPKRSACGNGERREFRSATVEVEFCDEPRSDLIVRHTSAILNGFGAGDLPIRATREQPVDGKPISIEVYARGSVCHQGHVTELFVLEAVRPGCEQRDPECLAGLPDKRPGLPAFPAVPPRCGSVTTDHPGGRDKRDGDPSRRT